jgi:hypothetical protein
MFVMSSEISRAKSDGSGTERVPVKVEAHFRSVPRRHVYRIDVYEKASNKMIPFASLSKEDQETLQYEAECEIMYL